MEPSEPPAALDEILPDVRWKLGQVLGFNRSAGACWVGDNDEVLLAASGVAVRWDQFADREQGAIAAAAVFAAEAAATAAANGTFFFFFPAPKAKFDPTR